MFFLEDKLGHKISLLKVKEGNHMEIKTQDGSLLNVTKYGNGPVLILIPGANGTGDIFTPAAKVLETNFTVITYDCRGYGRTVVAPPLPSDAANANSDYRLKADVQDVFTLADEFSPNNPVYVMGTSSGSIVAEEAFIKNPERFHRVAIHETPLNTVIDKTGKSNAQYAQMIQEALGGNFDALTNFFENKMHIQPIDAQMMNLSKDAKPDPMKMKSMMFWLKYEAAQYTGQVIDWSIFKAHKNRIIIFNGTDSVGFLPQTIDDEISKEINVPVTDIPGGHLGYAQKPSAFAEKLSATLLA
ncbi:alpha beta fold family hydrolase [Secundilactobacillus paracollinoides DSM 15502 = JCM 11969]|nr:alpha beta fold family hydrolase [Secundilactobacillus paracollinoides DSM 15502 = JCM 11969]